MSIDTAIIDAHGKIIDTITAPVIIVSSWAVAFGKSLGWDYNYIGNEITRKRIHAALWNPHLSIAWDKAIWSKSIIQSLLTHRDLSSSDSQAKILEILEALFQKNDTIIQINDNDFVTGEELEYIRWWDFWDNDETTYLIALLCSGLFEKITTIINTSSEWVYDENKHTIPYINPSDITDRFIEDICTDKTHLWTWWMKNKLEIAKKMAHIKNNTVYIVHGKKSNNIEDILKGNDRGTKISLPR